MNHPRIFNTFLIFFVFMLSGMTCTKALVILSATDVKISPNPVPVEKNEAKYQVNMIYPPGDPVTKIDSIETELLCLTNSGDSVIGTTIFYIPDDWDGKSVLRHSNSFALSNFVIPENDTIYYRMTVYRKYRSKSMIRLDAGRFIEIK